MKSLVRIIALVGVFLTLWVQVVSAQIEKHLGPLAEVAVDGVDGPWEGKLQDGWYNLINKSNPDAIRYFYTTEDPLQSGERTVEITTFLRGDGDTYAFSGIFFDREADNKYKGFAISDEGIPVLLTRTPEGVETTEAENMHARLDGSDVLKIVEISGSSVELYLNDVRAFTLKPFVEGQSSYTYGVIAWGTGRFAYTGFSISQKAGEIPFPQPGGDTGDGQTPEQPFPSPGGGEGTPITPVPVPAPVTTGEGPFAGMTPQDIYATEVLLGTTFGIYFHEFGHALIGETNLPATGPEEDTADGFSAFVLGSMAEEQDGAHPDEIKFLQNIAERASLLWYYQGRQSAQAGLQTPWQDEHSPDLRRFRNFFCIVYGSNPARYDRTADQVQLEPRTRERCKQEFAQRYDAWESILATVSRNLGPDLPGQHPADAPGGKINLTFQPAQSDIGKAIIRLLHDTGMMAEIMGGFEKAFVFPRDVEVEFRDCEEVNAWYDPSAGKVTMCYSLIEATSKIVFEAEAGGQTGGGGQGQPGTQPGGQSEAVAYLVGTWQTSIQTQSGNVTVQVTYAADGQYQVDATTPFGATQTIGNWEAQVAGQGQILLSTNPVRWVPQQLCDNAGRCEANQQYPEQIQIQVMNQNSVQADGTVWQRIR